jgi:hypothetical protein
MKSEELLIEFSVLASKYFVLKPSSSNSNEYLTSLLYKITENDKFSVNNFEKYFNNNHKTLNKISEEDLTKLDEFSKRIRTLVPFEKQIYFLLFFSYNNQFNLNNTSIELFSILSKKINIPEYALENIFTLYDINYTKVFKYPIIYIQNDPINLSLLVEGNIYLNIITKDCNIEVVKATNESFFIINKSQYPVLLNKQKLISNAVYVLNEYDHISFNNEKIDFQKIFKMNTIKEELPNIILTETESTPFIYFNASSNKFEIIGKSVPADSIAFFNPILIWLDKYINVKPKNAHLLFHLEYFSTASSKFILEILRRFETLYSNGTLVQIDWLYTEYDEDLKEAGENFAEIIEAPFNILITNKD